MIGFLTQIRDCVGALENADRNILRDVCDTIYVPTAAVLPSVPGSKLVPEAFPFNRWTNPRFYLHVREESIVDSRPFVLKRRATEACLVPLDLVSLYYSPLH